MDLCGDSGWVAAIGRLQVNGRFDKHSTVGRLLFAAALAMPLIGSAKTEDANPALDWMAGHWCTEMGGDTVEYSFRTAQIRKWMGTVMGCLVNHSGVISFFIRRCIHLDTSVLFSR
jgi:hypothetical protein